MKRKYLNFTLLYTKEPEGGYTVEVLELPGCVTYWESIDEATEMIKDAIEGYLMSLKKHNEDIDGLLDKKKFISSISMYETV